MKLSAGLTLAAGLFVGMRLSALAANFETPWQEETQYILEETGSDIAEMAVIAAHRPPLKPGAIPVIAMEQAHTDVDRPAYNVTIDLGPDGVVHTVLRPDPGVWSVGTYRPLVQALNEKLGFTAKTTSSPEDLGLLTKLLTPTVDVLTGSDLALSQDLEAHFSDSSAHARAALLLATFAAREPGGSFSEGKFALCRLAAHLAMADALRGAAPASATETLSSAALNLFCGRTAEALQQVAPFASATGPVATWARLIRMRCTYDYRIYEGISEPTLAEGLSGFRVIAAQKGAETAFRELHAKFPKFTEADWFRTAIAAGTSVGLSRSIADVQLRVENQEERAVAMAETSTDLDDDVLLINALNESPERCVTVGRYGDPVIRIIGWGTWAAALERRLCQAVLFRYEVMGKLGLPEAGGSLRENDEGVYSKLTLWPMVRRVIGSDEAYYRQAQIDTMALVHRHPEIVPAAVWNDVCFKVPYAPLFIPPPHAFVNEWHRFNPPPGTAFKMGPRYNQPSLTGRRDYLQLMERLHEINPYDDSITEQILYARYKGRPDPLEAIRLYGPAADYDYYACEQIAAGYVGNEEKEEPWLKRAAEIDPRRLLNLIYLQTARGEDADAAANWKRFLNSGIDGVTLANRIRWYVFYLKRTHQDGAAEQLANHAYEVYSANGIETEALFLEAQGKFAEAYQIHLKLMERYGGNSALLGFLMRMDEKGRSAVAPGELEKLKASLKLTAFEPAPNFVDGNPPAAGAITSGEDIQTLNAGYLYKDVVVAANGLRVDSPRRLAQIVAYKAFNPITLTVWRTDHYVTLRTFPPFVYSNIGFYKYP